MASLDAGTMEIEIITAAVTATVILNHKGLGFAIHALHASSTVVSSNRRVQGSGRSFMKGKTDGCVWGHLTCHSGVDRGAVVKQDERCRS